MKLFGHDIEFGIDWKQRSTIRGAVWFVGSIIATAYLFIEKDAVAFSAILGGTGIVAGGLGVGVKD